MWFALCIYYSVCNIFITPILLMLVCLLFLLLLLLSLCLQSIDGRDLFHWQLYHRAGDNARVG